MNIFIDLGAYTGDTLAIALKTYNNFDKFYAFDPVPIHIKLLKERYTDHRIVAIEKAASTKNGTANIFNHVKYRETNSYTNGTSLHKSKTNVDESDSFTVETINFSQFILDNFDINDNIVLKMDIEGEEYNVLEQMVNDKSIQYINKLFIEWHVNSIPEIHPSTHGKIVRLVRQQGLNVTGSRGDVGIFEGTIRETFE